MEADLQAIKSLYQEEIDAYKRQVDELRARNRSSDEKNIALSNKVRQLQELIEQANVANKDLHTAFEHVREENLKLQTHTDNREGNTFRSENDEMALETVQQQYINLARESISWISDKDKLVQRIKFLERECERYARDNVTLGKQVRHLLRTLEEERGMIIRRANQINDCEGPISSAADVIDKHLVTFESIEELQNQNQKLLSLVKELSKKEEEREIQIENDDIKRLNKEVDELKLHLDTVKGDRERIMTAFNTILKERDLFKILLCKTRQVEHMTPEIFQRMVTIACSAGPAITNEPENTQDKDAHINDLKGMISKLQQELADLKFDFDNVKVKDDEELKLKTGLLEQAHLKILSESRQAEALKERNQLLESNIKSLSQEFEEIRTKSQKLVFELEQLDKDKKDLTTALEEEKQRRQSEISIMLSQIQEREHITELKGMISSVSSNLYQELADLREDFKNARAENNDDLKTKLEQAQLKIYSESQQVQALKERNQILEININSLTTELQRIRSELQRLVHELEQSVRDRENLHAEKISITAALEKEKQRSHLIAVQPIPKSDTQPIKFNPQTQEYQSKISKLQIELNELQRLRTIERNARLKLMKKVHLLDNMRNHQPTKDPSFVEKNEPKPEDQSNKPSGRMIVLKRRKIV